MNTSEYTQKMIDDALRQTDPVTALKDILKGEASVDKALVYDALTEWFRE